MAEDKISVVGISTYGGLIGPNGNHLRWSFPGRLGFPTQGFNVYRKSSREKPNRRMDFSPPLGIADLRDRLETDGVELIPGTSGGSPASGARLEVRFPQSIAHVQVEIIGGGPTTMWAYRDTRPLAHVSADTEVAEIYCAGITRLVINLGSRQILSIVYATEDDVCRENSWAPLKSLLPPRGAQEAMRERFESGLSNYYAASLNDAREKYEPRAAAELILWLSRLLLPTDEFFEEPDARPDLLKVRSPRGSHMRGATYLQSVFLLAALDPNIARLLSLYWVDAFEPSRDPARGEEELPPPDRDQSYDYKVEGVWENGKRLCGLVLNLGRPPASQPPIKAPLEGQQLAGLRWVNGTPYGRIGLKWPRPGLELNYGTGSVEPVQPVLYELKRFYAGKDPEILEPVLVSRKAWDNPHLYVDRDVRPGDYVYEVRPIDIFGQLGAAIRSGTIPVEDLEAPPPPIRSRAKVSPAPANDRVRLQFEFGAAQHQQAPDVKEFTPYWRPDTLLTRASIRVTVTSTSGAPGALIHTLQISHEGQPPIPVFAGDVITNVVTGEQTPPANLRRRYRVAEVLDADVLVLEPTTEGLNGGVYELVQDPHNRGTWTRLQDYRVAWRAPLHGALLEVRDDLPVEVVGKSDVPRRPNPFASIPAERRGRQSPDVSPPPEVVEVEIDRLLTEPDVFAGGTATRAGEDFELIYVVSNPADRRTRVALPAGTTIEIGETLTLRPPTESSRPPSELSKKVRLLRIRGTVDQARLDAPGGEIAFEYVTDGAEATAVMRVISNAVNHAGSFDLVVRAEDAQAVGRLRLNPTQLRYYAPYVLDVPLTLAEGGGAPIALPLRPSDGFRDGFIALSATDVYDNEGPLSTPAQFSVVRPRPTGRPSRPYPCVGGTEAEGYASPPNRSGRATVCLTWEAGTLSPAEGARYEVARALDNSIPVAHLRAWQTGKIREPAAPVIAGESVEGELSGVTLENGLIHATFRPQAPITNPALFRNGRLKAIVSATARELFFHVTSAKIDDAGVSVGLLLSGPADPLPGAGAATLEASPDYSDARSDIPTLQRLAAEAPDAFALTTGVPVEENRFIDDVAGKGRNSFFYRVRAVDAAENRSDWSDISLPFHQADTTPPEAPNIEQVLNGDRSVTLVWRRDRDSSISEFQIYRREDAGSESFDSISEVPYSVVGVDAVSSLPLNAIGESLILPRQIEFDFPDLTDAEIASLLAERLRIDQVQTPIGTNLFNPATSKVVFERRVKSDGTVVARVTALTEIAATLPGTWLRVIAREATISRDPLSKGTVIISDDSSLQTWADRDLEPGKSYEYRIVALKSVKSAPRAQHQSPTESIIRSRASAPVKIVAMDRSVPAAPLIAAAHWVDLNDDPVTSPSASSRLRLLIEAASNTSQFLVQRNTPGSDVWSPLLIGGLQGWRPWPPGVLKVTVIAEGVAATEVSNYRALVRAGNGRQSEPSRAVRV